MVNTNPELAEHSQAGPGAHEEPQARHPKVAAGTDAKPLRTAPANSEANKTAAKTESKARIDEHRHSRFARMGHLLYQVSASFDSLKNGLTAMLNQSGHAIKERSDDRINRLESDLRRLQTANETLEQHARLHEQEWEQQRRHDLKKHHNSNRDLIEEHNVRYKDLRAICEQKVHDNHEEAMRTVQGAQRKARDMGEKYEASQKSCRELEKEILTLNGTVRSMQSARMESADATRWPSRSASTIEHDLKVIFSHVRQWANSHSKLPFEELFHNQRFDTTVNRLVDRGCVVDPARLHECLMRNKGMQKPGKASSLLLTAAVTCEIVQKIIGDPFFAFTGRPQEHTLPADWGQALTLLLEWLKNSDEKSCEAVRCQILRLLQPATNNQSESADYIRYVTEGSRNSAVSVLAATIMEDFMGERSEDERDPARKGLESIMLEAAELSSSLWTRMARIETANLPVLSAIEESAPVYRSSSKSLEPHSIHGMDLDADPKSLDGCDVVLLCSPAVFRAGNSDGEDYHKSSLLKKAVVWLG